jgi:hypothetical protein
MEKGKGDTRTAAGRARTRRAIFHFPFSILLASALLALVACGAPGDPTPPRPPVPEAIADLAARQSGNNVVLTFTLPAKTTEGNAITEPPDIEIFRAFGESDGKNLKQVYTIPSALVDTYLDEGRFRFADPVKPEDAQQAMGRVTYQIRTRLAKRRASEPSNLVALRVLPVPERIGEVRARVTEAAIELEWNVPPRADKPSQWPSILPIASLAGYRVYRGELEPGAEIPTDLARAPLKSPLALLGPAPSPSFRDTRYEFGRRYVYVVRSVAQYELDSVESADSAPAVVSPLDTFAPAAPANLVAVLVPASAETPAIVELSWGISAETDLAGYHIYRSAAEGTAPERLNRELLQVPTFRDTRAEANKRYSYFVTAVDRSGNESPRSAAVTVEVPAPGN